MKNTAFLDAVRAVAALWVAAAHCCIWGGYDVFGLPSAKEAVDLFIILSGFLMVYTWRRKDDDPRRPRTIIAFYVRRLFRIAPAYYLCLALITITWPHFAGGYETFRAFNPAQWQGNGNADPSTMAMTVPNILLHITFLFGLLPRASFSTMLPDWSLSLEMQFYAVFPLLFWLLVVHRRSAWMFLAIGIASMAFTVAYAAYWRDLNLAPFREPSLLPFKLAVFLAGMLLHEARRDGRVDWLKVAIAAALLAGDRWVGADAPSALYLLMAGFMGLAWLRQPPVIQRLASTRLIGLGADCSYSVYLFHGPVLALVGAPLLTELLGRGWNRAPAVLAMSAVVLLLVYPLSWAVYRLVEKPANRYGEGLARRIGRGDDGLPPQPAPLRV